MSDKLIVLLEKELDRFHKLLDSSTPDEDEYWFALNNIDKIMTKLTQVPTEIDLEIDKLDGLAKSGKAGLQ